MTRARTALCINTGSSSLKAALVHEDGRIERYATPLGHDGDAGEAVAAACDALLPGGSPDVVGHRVVHGGPDFVAPVLVDAVVVERLRALVPLAPLHQPAALAGIEAAARRLPGVPEVACFDTAFHHPLPALARRLPIPAHYADEGVQRYGFHGLSYESVVGHLGPSIAPRTVIAHLGSGSSLVALRDGVPVDTTMGLTPGGGVVMATRSGDLDPGVVLFLVQHESDAARVGTVLEDESGLLALSGTTADVRELETAAVHDERAQFALDAFVLGVAKGVAALTAVLGGLDLLVFTGGVGAGSRVVRAGVAARLAWLGVDVEPAANARGDELLSGAGARVVVLAVETDEETVIARHAWAVTAEERQERARP